MNDFAALARPKVTPSLHPNFKPIVMANRAFVEQVKASGKAVPMSIGVERNAGLISVFKTVAFPEDDPRADLNLAYAERVVKMLLWQKGGWKVIIGGPKSVGEHIRKTYAPGGARAFDAEFMGGVYEHPFTVEIIDADKVPQTREESIPLGRHLDGYRIGFDLGASDRKVAAVVNGEEIYSEEVNWDPRNNTDPSYHYKEIMTALKTAASHMPRVDGIGGSSAGVYIDNMPRVASLFRGIPKDLFEKNIKPMFLKMKREWGDIPFEVVNDGEVTALAGAMSLNDNEVLGVAMGSSEAAGYVNSEGCITGWLNELAFAPVDADPNAPADEWSQDVGVGVQYFSQQAVFRLAPVAGIPVDNNLGLAERLKSVQEFLAKGDERAVKIWETIGCFLGYGIAHYASFYDLKHVLVLGRVTSGDGGTIMLDKAAEVFNAEFPELVNSVQIHLPDEKIRRVGQAVAAASLPKTNNN